MTNAEAINLAESVAAHHGAHVIDAVMRGSHHKQIVEIFIDAEGGVTTDLCSLISRETAEKIDGQNLIRGSYDLVVSSPGIDRPLKFPWQYKKHTGRKLKVSVRGEEGLTQKSGKLISVDDNGIVLEIGNGTGPVPVRFDAIAEAIVQAPW